MFQFLISDIDINKINNSVIEKLKEKFQFNEIKENILYSNEGYYVISDNNITLFKIINKDNLKEEFYLDKYTLLGNHIYIKKIEDVMQLPVLPDRYRKEVGNIPDMYRKYMQPNTNKMAAASGHCEYILDFIYFLPISCIFPYFSCIFFIAKIESITSSGVSPIPTSIPVVMGIFNFPEFSNTSNRAFGFLLGAK